MLKNEITSFFGIYLSYIKYQLISILNLNLNQVLNKVLSVYKTLRGFISENAYEKFRNLKLNKYNMKISNFYQTFRILTSLTIEKHWNETYHKLVIFSFEHYLVVNTSQITAPPLPIQQLSSHGCAICIQEGETQSQTSNWMKITDPTNQSITVMRHLLFCYLFSDLFITCGFPSFIY